MLIKTHDSESQGQEAGAVAMQRKSELFTCSTTKKFADTVGKALQKLLPSYYRPSTFLLAI